MCGIVGAIASREVTQILLEGLKRLEYRGYDSAGMALINANSHKIKSLKTVGKVASLVDSAAKSNITGKIGIAHTRWATHGKPSNGNAHPHCSHDQIAIVHNGIIENFESIRESLKKDGYNFKSQTDSEVIAHLIHKERNGGKVALITAVKRSIKKLNGAYGICVVDNSEDGYLVVARSGSPLVIGVGIGENFVASDPLALGQVTDRFIYLEEGDVVKVSLDDIKIWQGNKKVTRAV
ncbi:MAG: glutamine--fructose-6-phosphate aminotransferase, partial [Pseudohongiellaceae bacterium]